MSEKKLQKKESDLFTQLVNCYENKQYKKGLGIADSILKKVPEHGETQSMKGLIYNCMGKKDLAFELIKNGLKNDVRSHICWHVFGLYHRADNNYPEAMKCYMNALKINSTNQNILRDLSWLQIQMRDISGFVITRNKILESRPNMRSSWVTSSVANYLGEQYQVAFDLITKYRSRTDVDKAEAYDESELYLYQCDCLIKLERYEEAIVFLNKQVDNIVDILSYQVKLAELHVLNGKFIEAKALWYQLVKDQPDNYRFHCGLQVACLELDPILSKEMFALKHLELPSTTLELNETQRVSLKDMYSNYDLKTRAVNKILLTLCHGDDELNEALDKHLKASLHKAIPALYHDIFSLVRISSSTTTTTTTSEVVEVDHSNTTTTITTIPQHNLTTRRRIFAKDSYDIKNHEIVKITLNLVNKYINNLRLYEQFEDNDSVISSKEPPTSLLWALYLKAHILEMSGDLHEALVVINESIEHTATAIDMYGKKARILKKLGDLPAAAVTMDECRQLDLQDRYLNNKATKYLLRCNEIELGMNTISIFVKHDGEPQRILYELQCSWYELELADAYARTKQWGSALRQYYAIKKHFNDFHIDMFDFHSYCMRKSTLRAYLDVMKSQSDLYCHKFYQRAICGALRICLHLVDSPEDIDGLGHLPVVERKKRREKNKKAKKKAEEEAKKIAEEETSINKKDDTEKQREAQPDEDFYLTKDFLVEAIEWCNTLVHNKLLLQCTNETISLIVDVYTRRGEYVLAMEALVIGMNKDSNDSYLVYSFIRLVYKLKYPGKKSLGLLPDILGKLKEQICYLLKTDYDLDSYLDNYLLFVKDNKSLLKILTLLKSQLLVNKDKLISTCYDLLHNNSNNIWEYGKDMNVNNILEIIKFLNINLLENHEITIAFTLKAKEKYPNASIFVTTDHNIQSLKEISNLEKLENVTIN